MQCAVVFAGQGGILRQVEGLVEQVSVTSICRAPARSPAIFGRVTECVLCSLENAEESSR